MEILAFSLSFADVGSILLAAMGLGLVIFIHELGHFAVAKWCGVKVEKFSIGFGPALWKHTRGEARIRRRPCSTPWGASSRCSGRTTPTTGQMTDQQVAKDPRSYTAKSVPQRIAIISAGVINNMVSAVLFFIIAFLLGVKYQPAVEVGGVTPGDAGVAGRLALGDEIRRDRLPRGREAEASPTCSWRWRCRMKTKSWRLRDIATASRLPPGSAPSSSKTASCPRFLPNPCSRSVCPTRATTRRT